MQKISVSSEWDNTDREVMNPPLWQAELTFIHVSAIRIADISNFEYMSILPAICCISGAFLFVLSVCLCPICCTLVVHCTVDAAVVYELTHSFILPGRLVSPIGFYSVVLPD